VQITARPAFDLGDGAVMLSFEKLGERAEVPAATPAAAGGEEPAQEGIIDDLEKELEATRQDLRNTVEELETSNEELRSSNEESMSMNEELQSANEELEATSEELRSLNEELMTVNAQLREKVEQLEQAHDDLQNFFSSTKIATLFLDDSLCVKRFTPAAQALLGIDHADTGRCAGDIARELLQNELVRDARAVLEELAPRSREIQTQTGKWIVRRVLPYRTEGRSIEGVVVTFVDVTELKQANELLEAKSRRLDLAWEAARGGIYEHRVADEASTTISGHWAEMLGYRQEELPSEGFLHWLREQVHPDDREGLDQAYEDFVEGLASGYKVEVRLRHKAGRWIWVRGLARALERDAYGRVRRLIGMMLDITDLKQTEEALRESEARFREMADGLPLMVWVHGPDGDQELVNESFCDFFNVRREEMKGGTWRMLIHPEDEGPYTEEFLACIRDRRPFHAEARVKRADGAWRWVESWGRPRFTSSGAFAGLVGSSADITDRKESEAALRESEERFRTLADNIAQHAWMADQKGWIFWYNRRWYDYTGTSLDEVEGWGWRKVLHPEHVERVVDKISACFEAGEPWEDTFPLRGKDGRYRWFLSRAIPIRGEDGQVTRWFGTNTDVTEQREAEEQLRKSHQRKNEFLAMLGHELRNPLAAIRNATELIKRTPTDDQHLQRAEGVLDRQSEHMATLLDGLLDVSRITRGKLDVETEPTDLLRLLRQVCSDLVDKAREREVALELDSEEETIVLEADPARLTQIFQNLIDNGIKFTDSGGKVVIEARSQGGEAVVAIRDTGIGFSPEMQEQIFDGGGLGLGLALARGLAELHGGSVEARSEGAGRGAEFIVRLPLEQPSVAEGGDGEQAASAPRRRPVRILLVEDNEDSAEMLRQVLALSGHVVQVASRGDQAVALAREQAPQVVLCDLGLPGGMSGFDVAQELRRDAQTRRLPLVALSGYGRPEDKARAEEAGFDAHLTKPVDGKALEQALAELTLEEEPRKRGQGVSPK
jgi:PAS domain S-box-containing protein